MDQGEMIETLSQQAGRLRAAMQSGNAAAIEHAAEEFRETVEAARAVRNWRAHPALRKALTGLREELEQSRALACLLADMTGQMHEMVVTRARDARQPVYSRQGVRTA